MVNNLDLRKAIFKECRQALHNFHNKSLPLGVERGLETRLFPPNHYLTFSRLSWNSIDRFGFNLGKNSSKAKKQESERERKQNIFLSNCQTIREYFPSKQIEWIFSNVILSKKAEKEKFFHFCILCFAFLSLFSES